MAIWYPKENTEKVGLFGACMWTGDNLGFINDNFCSEFYADDNDTLWIKKGLSCKPGSYIAYQDGQFKVYDKETFLNTYKPLKE